MKTNLIVKSILAAVLLSGSSTVLVAQNAPTACPLGHERGYGRSLTPEQRAEHRAAVQQMVAELRQKQAQGALTEEEQAWLQQIEQRCGPGITGTGRGGGRGNGPGAGNGGGQRKRQGLRDGTGPRHADGTCPKGNVPQRRGRP